MALLWNFWKLHGLGNDYLYFDVRQARQEPDWSHVAPKICDRHFGVGADGIITVYASPVADAGMHIFNADGSQSEMCGNGLRALAKWLYDRGLAGEDQTIQTDAGILYPKILKTEAGKAVWIRVNMGKPQFSAKLCGLADADDEPFLQKPMALDDRVYEVSLASMGNPHLIIAGEPWDVDMMAQVGKKLETHPWFPMRINVHRVTVRGRHRLFIRHWERGAGLTLACGTGVAASSAVMIRLGQVDSPVQVTVPGGQLEVEWSGHEDDPIYLTGPAEEVFSGTYDVT